MVLVAYINEFQKNAIIQIQVHKFYHSESDRYNKCRLYSHPVGTNIIFNFICPFI